VKDYSKGDILCTGLSAILGVFETTAAILLWLPIPGKICTVLSLKGVSYMRIKTYDLCAA
jgi:hypothetical protein